MALLRPAFVVTTPTLDNRREHWFWPDAIDCPGITPLKDLLTRLREHGTPVWPHHGAQGRARASVPLILDAIPIRVSQLSATVSGHPGPRHRARTNIFVVGHGIPIGVPWTAVVVYRHARGRSWTAIPDSRAIKVAATTPAKTIPV